MYDYRKTRSHKKNKGNKTKGQSKTQSKLTRRRVYKTKRSKQRLTRRKRSRKQLGGGWGFTNAIRGIQYNLVTLGNNFSGQPTPSSANPYPTQQQYMK
jgi:hypothetical protein